MGLSSLQDMLEFAQHDQALRWHLTSNCFPPLSGPADFVMAKKAIELAREDKGEEPVIIKLRDCEVEVVEQRKGRPLTEEELDRDIFLQHGDAGRKVTANEIVEAWHLDSFLADEDADGG